MGLTYVFFGPKQLKKTEKREKAAFVINNIIFYFDFIMELLEK